MVSCAICGCDGRAKRQASPTPYGRCRSTTATPITSTANHSARYRDDGDLKLFESGAALLHLAHKSETLMPRDPRGAAETLQWTISALNSLEMVTVPWWFLKISGQPNEPLTGWMTVRLGHLEDVLSKREWLVGDRFTVADLLMADVLRVPDVRAFGDRPATEAYVARVTGRPAFKKAKADQLAFFEAADAKRTE